MQKVCGSRLGKRVWFFTCSVSGSCSLEACKNLGWLDTLVVSDLRRSCVALGSAGPGLWWESGWLWWYAGTPDRLGSPGKASCFPSSVLFDANFHTSGISKPVVLVRGDWEVQRGRTKISPVGKLKGWAELLISQFIHWLLCMEFSHLTQMMDCCQSKIFPNFL